MGSIKDLIKSSNQVKMQKDIDVNNVADSDKAILVEDGNGSDIPTGKENVIDTTKAVDIPIDSSMIGTDGEDEEDEGDGLISETSVNEIAKAFARNRYLSLDLEAIEEFLGVEASDQLVLSEGYPSFMNAVVAKAVQKYFDANGFKVLQTLNFKYGEKVIPVEYGNMVTSRGVTENLIIKGMMFVENQNGICAVLTINFCCPPAGFVDVAFAKENQTVFANAISEINQYVDELDYLRGEAITAGGSLLNVGDYDWDDIVLEDGVRESIDHNILNFLSKRELYEKNGIPFKRGVILEGPPGTGKTLVTKVIANKVKGTTFISATARDMQGSEDVSNLFAMARRYAPTVIAMEDIDFFGPSRVQGKVMRMTGELLNQMDGIEDNKGILVVATTNHAELLDDAIVRRPGRFDVKVNMGALSLNNREILLKRFLNGRQKTEDVDFSQIATHLEGFTGSHIKDLANDVCIQAVNNESLDEDGCIILLKEHFDKAISRIKQHMGIDESDVATEDDSPMIKEMSTPMPVRYMKTFGGFTFKKAEIETDFRTLRM